MASVFTIDVISLSANKFECVTETVLSDNYISILKHKTIVKAVLLLINSLNELLIEHLHSVSDPEGEGMRCRGTPARRNASTLLLS